MRVHLLPEHLIDQIKAGEVIERPCNVLKELMENSLDAESTSVTVTIKNSGLDLILVEDNGRGIVPDDLELAFARHATSKISTYQHLYNLESYGFRGEALAAMASVSKIKCRSQCGGQIGEILIEGGKILSPLWSETTIEVSHGTQISVRDLFFNTPVRLKFVRSQVSERQALLKFFHAFVLAYPQVNFTLNLESNNPLVFKSCSSFLPHLEDSAWKYRLERIAKHQWGNANSIAHQASYQDYHLEFWINLEVDGNHKNQFVLINNRLVLDQNLIKLMGRILSGRLKRPINPSFVLKLTIPKTHIDVNVHPHKTSVKFIDHHLVTSLISGALGQIVLPKTIQPESLITPTKSESKIDSVFHIIQVQEKNYLFLLWQKNIYMLSGHFFLSHLTQSKTEEMDIIPVLVGELIEIPTHSEKHLDVLSSLEIQLERLDDNRYHVKAVPDYLFNCPLSKMIDLFFNFKPEATQENWIKATLESELLPNIFQAWHNKLSPARAIQKLIDLKIVKVLDGSLLESFFKDSRNES